MKEVYQRETHVKEGLVVVVVIFFTVVIAECLLAQRLLHGMYLNFRAWKLVAPEVCDEQEAKKALAYATKAVFLTEGRSAAVLDTLAWTHFQLGDFGKAEQIERRALELAPGHPEVIEHLERIVEAEQRSKGDEARN